MPSARAHKVGAHELFPTQLLADQGVSSGALRWYVAQVPCGREELFATRCKQLISSDVLADAFFPQYEKFIKHQGVWQVKEVPLFSGYCFLATCDAQALLKALAALSFPVKVVGRTGSAAVPLEPQVQSWLSSALDAQHVLRASTGAIEGGALKVSEGPLRGSEAFVRRIDRHKRVAYLGLSGSSGKESCQLRAGLEVPEKH